MELKTSVVVKVIDGRGTIELPEALKRDPLRSHIQCVSVCLKPDKEAKSTPVFIVCGASYHMTKSREMKRNVLGMFSNSPTGGCTHFHNGAMPITLPQETFEIEIVNDAGERKEVTAAVVFEIKGIVSNRNLAI